MDPRLERLVPKALMESCLQDPKFHAEGDVWTHTRMAYGALEKDPSFGSLDPAWQERLRLGILFHDCAKPFVSFEDEDGIRSPNHAARGAKYARVALYKDGADPATREAVFGLVLRHGAPLSFMRSETPERKIIEASWSVPCRMIARLALADVLGRICKGGGEGMKEQVALFEETAKEMGCLDCPKEFPSSHSMFLYFNEGKEIYDAFDDTKFEVVLMSGLPGAGKDHWLKANWDGPVVSLDELRGALKIGPEDDQGRVVAAAKTMAKEYMRDKASFAWNATNVTWQMRNQLIRLFRAYNAKIRIVYVEAPYGELMARKAAPERVLDQLMIKLDVPAATEAHEVSWVIGGRICSPLSWFDTPTRA